jgi:hypothetical protein
VTATLACFVTPDDVARYHMTARQGMHMPH